VWFDSHFAERRYRTIAEVLSRNAPDVMAFQEVTRQALDIILAQGWVRDHYVQASVVGDHVGPYGMLMLSRVPVNCVTYSRLPGRANRGFLRAELGIAGSTTALSSVHLDSGKRSARLRARQLRAIFRPLADAESAVVLGDFNMRDHENRRIVAPYRDVWPLLRPEDPGYTADTSTNLMRLDMKNKPSQNRFDRVLVKGGWSPTHIELVGTEPISGADPNVFPSDHFGVRCTLRRAAQPARESPKRPLWRRMLRRQ
jgi:tyrosyl-DNA phosphodiesterase 2